MLAPRETTAIALFENSMTRVANWTITLGGGACAILFVIGSIWHISIALAGGALLEVRHGVLTCRGGLYSPLSRSYTMVPRSQIPKRMPKRVPVPIVFFESTHIFLRCGTLANLDPGVGIRPLRYRHEWCATLWKCGCQNPNPRTTGFWVASISLPLLYPTALFFILFTVKAYRLKRERLDALCGKCHSCGYDLTANITGRCPECGVGVQCDRSTSSYQDDATK